MGQIPTFANGQFVDQNLLNNAFTQVNNSIVNLGSELFTPGYVNGGSIGITTSSLNVTINGNSTTQVLFGSGSLSGLLGNTAGSTNPSQTVNVSSLIPGSGSITCYIAATYFQLPLSPVQVVGPPLGHPDYNPNFVPFVLYNELADSVNFIATTTVPDNTTTMELCRFTLSFGQTSIPSVNTNNQVRAGAILSQSGEVIAADLAAGAAATNVGTLGGVLTGTLPNPGMKAGAASSNIGALGGVLTGTLPNPGMANGAASNNIGTLGGSLRGNLPNPTIANSGVGAGNYPVANVTVGADGRITTASNAQTQANTWSGANTFSGNVTITTPGVILKYQGSGASVYTDGSNNDIVLRSGTAASYRYWVMDANGNVSAAGDATYGGTIQGGYVTSNGNINAAGTYTGGAVSVNGNVQGASVDASNGNVTAFNGRLRATYGALNSGDGAAACILNDFNNWSAGSSGYQQFPNGLIIQWGSATVGDNTFVAFPVAFPHACLKVVVCEGDANSGTWGAKLPTVHGVGGIQANGYFAWALAWTYDPPNQGWIFGTLGENFIAIGY